MELFTTVFFLAVGCSSLIVENLAVPHGIPVFGRGSIQLSNRDQQYVVAEMSRMKIPRMVHMITGSKQQLRNGAVKYIIGYLTDSSLEKNLCKAWVSIYHDEAGAVIHSKTQFGCL